MTALARWQHALVDAIDTDRRRLPDAVQATTVPGPSIAQGCAVYRNNSRGARRAALTEVYPVCRRLVGERAFAGLAREYVRRAPSRDSDLNRFGAGFAGFVAATVATQPVYRHLVWLADLTRLEWLCHRVHYSAEDAPLDLRPLHDAAPAALHPRPASHIAWLRSAWPVHRIWAAHLADAGAAGLRLAPGDYRLLIQRPGLQVKVSELEPALFDLLEACAGGLSVAEMAADPRLAVERLGELVARRWLGALHRGAAGV